MNNTNDRSVAAWQRDCVLQQARNRPDVEIDGRHEYPQQNRVTDSEWTTNRDGGDRRQRRYCTSRFVM